jgi:hypothetical protein
MLPQFPRRLLKVLHDPRQQEALEPLEEEEDSVQKILPDLSDLRFV